MSVERIALRLVGVGPLLMHSKRLADPLDPLTKQLAAITSKAVRTEADHERIAQLEWLGGLWLADGRPCIPPHCLKRVFVDSAKKRRKGETAKAAFRADGPAILDYDGPNTVAELWADQRGVARRGMAWPGSDLLLGDPASMVCDTRPPRERWSIFHG